MTGESPVAIAVIVAGGTGERFGRTGGKQMALLRGEPVLAHTVRAVAAAASVRRVTLVCPPGREDEYANAVRERVPIEKPFLVATGGDTRQRSVAAGMATLEDEEIVVVHDGARPLVTPELIEAAVGQLAEDPDVDGIVVGHPAYDTLKIVEGGLIIETPDRERFWLAQTPQVFRARILAEAYGRAAASGRQATDDASLVEAIGGRVRMIEGPRDNMKITVDTDLAIADAVLSRRAAL